ncbi:MAG: copper amine oxidase N-terminal domain-containing protein [Tumebacillaceae bacterium]
MKKKALLGAGIALLMGVSIPLTAKAEAVSVRQIDAELWFSGVKDSSDETVPVMEYQGEKYVSLRYVAEHMGAQVTWDNDTKTVRIATESKLARSAMWNPYTTKPSGTKDVLTVEGVHFICNGQEKSLSTVLAFQGHLYVPDSFVAEAIGGVCQEENDYQTGIYFNVVAAPYDAQLKTFVAKHPKAFVGQVKPVQLTPNGPKQLAIAAHEKFSAGIYFIDADQKETQLHADMEEPERIDTVTQDDQNFVVLSGNAGAHTTYLDVYGLANGTPVKLTEFMGVNGGISWVQDGKLEVLVSNPTYRFDIVTTDGSKRDSVQRDLYEFNAETNQFDALDEYINGPNPTGNGNRIEPRQLASVAERELRDVDFAIQKFGYVNDWTQAAKDSLVAHTQALSFMHNDDGPLSLTTVKEDSKEAIYSYKKDGHELQILLTNDKPWMVTGFTVDGK